MKNVNTIPQTLKKINIIAFKNYKEILITLLLITLFSAVSPYAFSYFQGAFIDKIIEYTKVGGTLQPVYISILIFGGVYFVLKIADILYDFFDRRFGIKLATTTEKLLLDKKSQLSVADYDNSETWSMIQKATEAQGQIHSTIYFQNSIIRQFFSLIAAIIIVANFSWVALVVILITTIPNAVINYLENNADWKRWLHETAARKHLSYLSGVFSSEKSLAEIKFFQVAKKLIQKWNTDKIEIVEKKIFVIQEKFLPYFGISALISILGYIVVFYILTQMAINGEVSIGKITFYISSIFALNNSFSSLISKIGANYQNVLKLKEYVDFLDLDISTKEEGIEPENLIHPPVITIKNLYFSYPEKDVLKNISCTIKPGEKIAVVGLNGAGKTTLIKMLTKIYNPNSGSIHIDEHLLEDLSTSWWYNHLGVLSQEYTNYSFTVEESIAIGSNSEFDAELVMQCAQLAQVHETIMELPLGYKTQLGKQFKNGHNFSIGQWQKIAIARALYRQPKVLILDEPTSAVDAEAEEAIFNNLHDLSGDTTLIFVSHRFSTIRRADRIMLVQDGTIAEQGSHEQLMKLHGEYSRLFNLQAKSYQ